MASFFREAKTKVARSAGTSVRGDGQGLQASQHSMRAPGELVRGKPQVGGVTQQGADGDLSFEPGERCPEAVVDSAAEREMRVGVLAAQIEAIGLGKWFGSRLAAPMRNITKWPRFATLPSASGVSSRAKREVIWTGLSKRSISCTALGRRAESALSAENASGSRSSAEHAVADEVHGGFVAGREDEPAGGDEFLVAQLIARFLNFDHRADKVAAR